MNTFSAKLNGPLFGVLRWSDWDALLGQLKRQNESRWYAYAVGAEVPCEPLAPEAFRATLFEIDDLLRREHDEAYLGIVYVDKPDGPSLVKIYDPNNLGATCGSSGFKVQPGWVLSLDPPEAIDTDTLLPGNRKRWWNSLLGRFSA